MMSATFPNQVREIERLRVQDETFAEICRDYETLLRLLPVDAETPDLDALQESLEALEGEILSYLERATETSEK